MWVTEPRLFKIDSLNELNIPQGRLGMGAEVGATWRVRAESACVRARGAEVVCALRWCAEVALIVC